MVDDNQSLLDVLAQLEKAVDEKDWNKSELIDKRIKVDIEEAIANAKTEESKADIIELLTKVQSLYSLLITSTEESRKETAIELKKITSDKKVANFYLKSSQYK